MRSAQKIKVKAVEHKKNSNILVLYSRCYSDSFLPFG